MYMQVHYVVVLLNNIRTSGFLMKSPYCKKKREIFILEPELWGTGHFGTGNRGTGNRFPGTIRGESVPWFPCGSPCGSLVPLRFPLWFPGTVQGEPGNRFPGSPGTQVQVQEQVPRNRKKVVKEQPQLHMTNTKVSSHVGHACTEEIMIQQFTRKIT